MIKFTTQGPNATEFDYSTATKFQKNVTVSHNSTLHYTNVTAYSDINEGMIRQGADPILLWVVNGSKIDVTNDERFNVEIVDSNNNLIPDKKVYEKLEKLIQEIINNSGRICICGHSESDHLFNNHLGTRLHCVYGMERK